MKENFIKKFSTTPDHAILNALPEAYFSIMDDDDHKFHYESLLKLKTDPSRVFRSKGDIEEFVIHDFNTSRLLLSIQKTVSSSKSESILYRIFANKEANFMLTAIYKNVHLSKRKDEFYLPDAENIDRLSFKANDNKGKTHIQLKCKNISRSTFFRNLHETFLLHHVFPVFTELWEICGKSSQMKSYYQADFFFDEKLTESVFLSMKNDLERYLQTYIKPMSVFDMVGPAMVGPSSSHTAGANKIGQIARNIFLAAMKFDQRKITRIEIKLIGSFRDTGVGHRTPSAVAGGLWGYATDDSDMMKYGDPEFLKKNGIDLDGCMASFNGFVKGDRSDDEKYAREKNNNIAEINAYTADTKMTVTGFSIGGGNVEVRFENEKLPDIMDGKKDFYFYNDKIFSEKPDDKATLIKKIYKDSASGSNDFSMPFNTFEELLEELKDKKISMIHMALDVEKKLQGCTQQDVFDKMRSYWQIMKRSVEEGLHDNTLSLLKLSGQDSNRIHDYAVSHPLFDNLYGKANAYATAVNEINAKSGVIVACPTAGSCGILPGVLKAYQEIRKVDEEKILEALVISGFLCMILFDDVTTAGADYGCQAEVGAGTAMAASALTFLEGGDNEMIVQAFILSLKNCLGLTCDPVAGLVEVPCVKRNGLYTSLAISSSLMALSGVCSFISPDEVVLTLKEAGEKLNSDFKETAKGGLAKTRDGKQVERDFEKEVHRFFS